MLAPWRKRSISPCQFRSLEEIWAKFLGRSCFVLSTDSQWATQLHLYPVFWPFPKHMFALNCADHRCERWCRCPDRCPEESVPMCFHVRTLCSPWLHKTPPYFPCHSQCWFVVVFLPHFVTYEVGAKPSQKRNVIFTPRDKDGCQWCRTAVGELQPRRRRLANPPPFELLCKSPATTCQSWWT